MNGRHIADAPVSPIVAVTDLARARAFYEDQLGLEGSPSPGGGWMLRAGEGTTISLLPGVEGAGSVTWPVATFRVDDVHAVVRRLRERGVSFLGRDDIPFDLDDDGVSSQADLAVAWMKDPDGSVLTIYTASDEASQEMRR